MEIIIQVFGETCNLLKSVMGKVKRRSGIFVCFLTNYQTEEKSEKRDNELLCTCYMNKCTAADPSPFVSPMPWNKHN
jgi:hypothetical protein